MEQQEAPRIIVGLDRSMHDSAVLAAALTEAGRRNATLRVVHAVEITMLDITTIGPAGRRRYAAQTVHVDEMRTKLREQVGALAVTLGVTVPIEYRVERGDPATCLLGAARDAELIVAGTRGDGTGSPLLLGTVSQDLAVHATCPVLLIPATTRRLDATIHDNHPKETAVLKTMQYVIGTDIRGADGVCGAISRVIIDPVAKTVTHLVVEPRHRHDEARLVPVSLLDAASEGLRLRCTVAEYDRLDRAEETHFLAADDGYAGYGRGQALMLPRYGLGTGMWAGGPNAGLGTGASTSRPAERVTTDMVPPGETAIYRGDRVHATDGAIGRVQGLLIAASGHHVTHVLLQEGHLFGRKDVAVPIGAVTDVASGIRLSISKQQVRDLPTATVDSHRHPPLTCSPPISGRSS